MKHILLMIFVIHFVIQFSCSKKCESVNPKCYETPPTDEVCQAAFRRWFYNVETNSCEEKFYSGCSSKGFATKQECEECRCN